MPGSGLIEVDGRQYVLNVMPSLPDRREWQFRAPAALEAADVIELDLDWPAALRQPFDQGFEGSCVGNAQSKLWDAIAFSQGVPLITPSRRFIYYNARNYAGMAAHDVGSTIGDGIRGLVEFGAPPESELPYMPGEYAMVPSAAHFASGLNHQALKWEAVAQAPEVVGAALALGRPVSIGFVVYQNFVPDANGVIPFPAGGVLGGHNVLVVGRRHAQRLVKIFNSWGPWGLGGYAWMGYDYVFNPSATFELKTINLVEGEPTPPAPPPTPVPGPSINDQWKLGENRTNYSLLVDAHAQPEGYGVTRFIDIGDGSDRGYITHKGHPWWDTQ